MDLITALNSDSCNCIIHAEQFGQTFTVHFVHLFGSVQIDLTGRHHKSLPHFVIQADLKAVFTLAMLINPLLI